MEFRRDSRCDAPQGRNEYDESLHLLSVSCGSSHSLGLLSKYMAASSCKDKCYVSFASCQHPRY